MTTQALVTGISIFSVTVFAVAFIVTVLQHLRVTAPSKKEPLL